MKKTTLFCMFLTCITFVSCNKKQSQKSIEDQNLTEKPVSVQCYTAIYETDTIDLKINTLKNNKISGNMEMKLLNMPIKVGKISGEFRGDTLFADYSFIQGTNDKVVFKNPMAFLKSGNDFILGNGKIVTYLGASYFAKGESIDFENVKYKFNISDCVQK
ncbi:hypothetical protein FNW25_10110 [Flavobacterium franklandianum]|uniref:Lipoprotein n=1 Tax=Flavobacterium franklandianum TaxID=2594430 RepID=A0A553CIV8_9FLAO|nr:hypothetical protein [Flavobacterium franklandianum]TRX20438.1 hypothetical protein FNW17_11290 [Flavobacterium franklandianum]TRX25121.1 hypothetical protein FNW25_10110 [Flavobacterium franklandianum]